MHFVKIKIPRAYAQGSGWWTTPRLKGQTVRLTSPTSKAG